MAKDQKNKDSVEFDPEKQSAVELSPEALKQLGLDPGTSLKFKPTKGGLTVETGAAEATDDQPMLATSDADKFLKPQTAPQKSRGFFGLFGRKSKK